ncbi:MAG: hypothetical protein K2X78_02850 [Burkholderiaceae bacterium]|nr:hypothetical protein [Burkholderiaceae bacterium]
MRDVLYLIGAALLVVALPVFGITKCNDWYEHRPETIARKTAEAERIAAEKLPRKVNDANGCEVWAFKPADRWLYFTRCAAKTETVNTWDVCRSVTSGKTTRTECTPQSMALTQEPRP